jgi:hypothetical protein
MTTLIQPVEIKKPVDGAIPAPFQHGNGILNAIISLWVIVAGTVMLGMFAQAHAVAMSEEFLGTNTPNQSALSELLTGSIWESLGAVFVIPLVGFLLLLGLMYSRRIWATVLSLGFIGLGVAVYALA